MGSSDTTVAIGPLGEKEYRKLNVDAAGNLFIAPGPGANPIPVKEVGPTLSYLAFGANPNIAAGVEEPVWAGPSTYSQIPSAQTLSIVSTNVNDTAVGTGAQLLQITGHDSSFNELVEFVATNGTTPVVTVGVFARVHLCIVVAAGAGGVNAGDITVTGTTTQLYLTAGLNVSRTARYTIPLGYTGYIKAVYVSCAPSSGATGAKSGKASLIVTPFGAPRQTYDIGHIDNRGSQIMFVQILKGASFPEKTDLRLSFTADNNNTTVIGAFEIALEPT